MAITIVSAFKIDSRSQRVVVKVSVKDAVKVPGKVPVAVSYKVPYKVPYKVAVKLQVKVTVNVPVKLAVKVKNILMKICHASNNLPSIEPNRNARVQNSFPHQLAMCDARG